MGTKEEWIFIRKETTGDEDREASHPWRDMTFEGMKEVMEAIKEKYPQFKDFMFEFKFIRIGYGREDNWYQLEGLTDSELVKILYGQK